MSASHHNLAAHQSGDHTTALGLYNRAGSTLEAALGPDLAAILVNLATLRRVTGHHEEADALDWWTHRILAVTVEPDHPTLTALTQRAKADSEPFL